MEVFGGWGRGKALVFQHYYQLQVFSNKNEVPQLLYMYHKVLPPKRNHEATRFGPVHNGLPLLEPLESGWYILIWIMQIIWNYNHIITQAADFTILSQGVYILFQAIS